LGSPAGISRAPSASAACRPLIIIGIVRAIESALQPASARALGRSLVAWYRRNRRALPWRRSRDPYRVWVSEVMLQQTTVKAVLPYYRRFLGRFPTIRTLAAAPREAVLAAWSGLGYYRRARHLHAAARRIVKEHGGRFPRLLEEALALPGIGRYTAGAILSIACGRRLPVLDGNVSRVLARLFLLRGDNTTAARRRRLWRLAAALVKVAPDPGDLNQALMELGATVCTPANPECGRCPVASRCSARAAGAQDRVPAPRRRREPIRLRATVALVRRRGRYLMRRREGTGLMVGLWEFPAVAADRAGRPPDGLRVALGEPIATVRHTITYRRYLVEVRKGRLLREPPRRNYRWVDPRDVARLPTSSLVSKVLARAHGGSEV
jgi:A/G-specific adenine glycosylase